MTKEHKLALIVGFALVLVVGVLISDHFSKASSAALDNSLSARDPRAFGSGTDELNGPIMTPPPISPEEQQRREALAHNTQMTPLPNTLVREEPAAPVAAGDGGNGGGDVAGMFRDGNPNTIVMGEPNGQAALDRNFEDVTYQPLLVQSRPERFEPVNQRPLNNIRQSDPLNDRASTAREPVAPPPIPPVEQKPATRHSVAEGESLFAIAQKYYGDGTQWTRIRDANPRSVDKDGSVRAGVSLVIPGSPKAGDAPQQSPAHAPADKSKRDASPAKPAPTGYALYTVKPGDTLGEVSQKLLKTSKRAGDIAALNKLDDPDHLLVGMQLKIPVQ